MKRIWKIFLIAFIIILLIIVAYKINNKKTYDLIIIDDQSKFNDYEMEDDLIIFIRKIFYIEDTRLIRTSLIKEDKMATKDEILSESMGLYLEYFLKNNKEEDFREILSLIDEYFIDEDNLIRWKISLKDKNSKTINAPVDDLRIINQLIKAYNLWGDDAFITMAMNLSEALYESSVLDNKLLVFNDKNSGFAPLVYYDFEALKRLSEIDSRWDDVLREGLDLAFDKKVDNLPLYDDQYWIKIGKIKEGEYLLLENLLTFYYLSVVGISDLEAVDWIYNSINEDKLYGIYNIENDEFYGYESPAIYGVVLRIANIYNDENLYNITMKRLEDMVVKSGYYKGGFVDIENEQGYSFDQLKVLLGL